MLSFFSAIAAGSSLYAVEALSKVSAAELSLFGEALALHTPAAGRHFLAALEQGDQDRMGRVLHKRSDGQLRRIAGTLRGDQSAFYNLPWAWRTPEGLTRIRRQLGEPVRTEPNLARDELMKILAFRHLFRVQLDRVQQEEGRELLQRYLEGEESSLLNLFRQNRKEVADFLLNSLRDPDMEDLLSRCATHALFLLAGAGDYADKRIMMTWPEAVEKDAGAFAQVTALGGFFLMRWRRGDTRVPEVVSRLREGHPDQGIILDELVRLMEPPPNGRPE